MNKAPNPWKKEFFNVKNLGYLKEAIKHEKPFIFPNKEEPLDYLIIDLKKDINATEKKIIHKISSKLIKVSNDIDKAIKAKQMGKLKNKTGQYKHAGELSLNYSYDINSPKILSRPFRINVDETISYWLYTITLSNTTNPNKTFGFCLAADIPFEIIFPMISHSTHELNHCSIKQITQSTFTMNKFQSILLFHMKLCYDLFLLKEFPYDALESFTDRLFTDSSEKKYLFVPLLMGNDSLYHIDWNMINHIHRLYNKVRCNTMESELINGNNPNELMKNNLFYTTYRTWNIYEAKDILYANDSYKTFILKLASYDNEYAETISNKYFNSKGLLYENSSDITGREIMQMIDTKSSSIQGYRVLNENYNIQINPNPIAYAYGNKMNFLQESYYYNTNIIKNQIKAVNTSSVAKKIVYSIFPIDHFGIFYLTKKEVEMVLKFPTIFTALETMLIPYQMPIAFKLNYDINNTQSFNYFLWAGTTPQVMTDYDYETLETLGDSILKMVLTIQLYDKYTQESSMTAGKIEKFRAQLIKNSNLYQIGINTCINQYIMSKEPNIKEWEFPLKSMSQMYHQCITEKILADGIEAFIGACYLKSFNLADSISFINQCKICPPDIQSNVEKYVYSEDSNDSSVKWKPMELLPIIKDINFIGLLSFYNVPYKCIESLEELEELLMYRFSNRELLIKAFRHESYNKPNKNDNYEKLELLGDSIVETYVSTSIFNWFGPSLYNQNKYDELSNDTILNSQEEINRLLGIKSKQFNNQFITHIKSYFCSNNFMCQVACFLQLDKFIQYNSSSSFNTTLESFQSVKNKNLLLHRSLNAYESPEAILPKFIADMFEALIGAIFCDCNSIDIIFTVLNRIYGPFIVYSALYFDELKYSCVDDFTRKFANKKRITVDFRIIPNIDKQDDNTIVGIYYSGEICYCTGKGKGAENAKQNAAIEGLRLLQLELEKELNKTKDDQLS